MEELVVIKSFRYRHEAEQARELLRNNGIETVVSGDDAGGYRPDLGMWKNCLLVQTRDVEKAKELLEVFFEKTLIEGTPEPLIEPTLETPSSPQDKRMFLSRGYTIPLVFITSLIFLIGRSFTKEEVQKKYFLSGQVYRTMTVKYGKANGIFAVYYQNGKIRWKGNYRNNRLDGHWWEYYEDGTLKSEGFYQNDQLEGRLIEYHKGGEKYSEGYYQEGKPEGIYKYYYKSGKLWEEFFYKNGQRLNEKGEVVEGVKKIYFENGGLAGISYYKDGRLDGELRDYYENGKLKFVAIMKNGDYEGKAQQYDESGQLRIEAFHQNGNVIELNEYDARGKLIFPAVY